MIRYCGRIRTSPFLCIPSFTSFSFASVCPRHSPDVFPAFSRPFLSLSFLRKGAGIYVQESSRLCAKAWAFLRKSAAVLAQCLRSLCAGPCVMRCHPCGCGGMPAAPYCGDSGVPRCRPCGCGSWRLCPAAAFRPPWRGPRAVSAGELLPAVRGCLCVLLLPSGKNAVA